MTTKQQRRAKRRKARVYGTKQKTMREQRAEQDRVDALMAKIITENHANYDLLSKPCDAYEDFDEARADIAEIEEVLGSTRMGVGLAAPQIGIMKRALVWKKTPVSEMFYMLNPVVVSTSEDTQSMFEGCLSYPGHVAEIDRPVEVEISWYDYTGTNQTNKFTGWEARILLHEIDHLSGVCRVGDAPEADRKYVGKK